MKSLSLNAILVLKGSDNMAHDNLIEARNKMVVKANDLIQKSRFDLSLQQQKIILYLISQIQPIDKEFKLYEFSVVDFCKVCGIDPESGDKYKDIKKAIKDIADKSIWIKTEYDEETLLRWVEKPYINRNSGTIKIKLDADMKPYLLQLKSNFTQYELIYTLRFRSKYSIRLYELIKSIHYKDIVEYKRAFSVEKLKELLNGENYNQYKDFKKRVLIPSINEINANSDKEISINELKRGNRVEYIELIVKSKSVDDMIKTRIRIEDELGLDQFSLYDYLDERKG